jgi:hypothetical protein
MQLADIEPGLHVVWDDCPSVETRNNLIEKIDAFNHHTFPSEFQRFALLLQDGRRRLSQGRRFGSDIVIGSLLTASGFMSVCGIEASGPS